MPITAPDVTGAAVFRQVSFRYIDASGDKKAHSIQVAPTVTPAQIQALGVALGAATNANLYGIRISDAWEAVAQRAPALQASRSESVSDHFVIQYGNAINQSERVYIPAPIEAMFNAGSDLADITDATLDAVFTAITPILSTYLAKSVRYNENDETNASVKI